MGKRMFVGRSLTSQCFIFQPSVSMIQSLDWMAPLALSTTCCSGECMPSRRACICYDGKSTESLE